MEKWEIVLFAIIGILFLALAVVSTYLTIQYWNTPAGEVPWWVWWLIG